ncbi:uncharacterized protein LOC127123658 [Lathyrus oleraceus]|uniref:uncharacterized protein LOC127123658 n=1 Tax=Pisum sativum TaxID=3888 RepID=UPI0021CE174E|nr:uncharacterized protein LOC127123658 [Pisum sativum]
MDEFFRISQCKFAKEIWDTLVETHEGTTEVERSRLNTLSQEYEMSRMQPGESILALQKRFVHLTNHLIAIGKTFTNDDLNLKEKKSKGIALKVESKEEKDEAALEEDENFMLLVKRLGKFFGKTNKPFHAKRNKHFRKREASTSTQEVTCYECGKQGHIKPDCLRLSKKGGFKGKKDFKNKKAYVAWEDNEICSSSESESTFSLFDEEDEVSSNFSLFDSDAQGAINELLEEYKILYKTISSQKKTILSLEGKIVTIEKDVNDEKQKMISEKQNFVCLKTTSNLWYLNSGCSKHMTGDINKFSNLALKAKGYVTYDDNNKGGILGIGKVGAPPFTSI